MSLSRHSSISLYESAEQPSERINIFLPPKEAAWVGVMESMGQSRVTVDHKTSRLDEDVGTRTNILKAYY